MRTLDYTHEQLIDAVNSQETIEGHAIAAAELRGFRAGWSRTGKTEGWQIIAGDNYQADNGINRPMCGGVFLDWKPLTPPGPSPAGATSPTPR